LRSERWEARAKQEAESGFTAKPWNRSKRVNPGMPGEGKALERGPSNEWSKAMQLDTREFRAEARFQRVSPQKARLVLALINGRRVGEALETVAFTKKGVAPLVEKVLRSAIQNANYLSQEQGLDVDLDNLYVKRALANEGPRMKRTRPAPMGRAFRYQRRMSHILISVAEKKRGDLVATGEPEDGKRPKRAVKTRARKAPAKKAAAKKGTAKKSAAKKAPAKKSHKSAK
jgi:large subunit ribosomal protein L22